MKAFILRGLGIECELEMRRAFEETKVFDSVEWLTLSELVQNPTIGEIPQTGDWIGIPGGFSFSDHFGSGRLLSLQLQEIDFFQKLESRGVNVFGVCNGFQVLCQAGIFGKDTSLEANRQRSFVNRWTQLEDTSGDKKTWKLPVRHGEGNLQFGILPEGVKGFLKYIGDFKNGSKEDTAGLIRRNGDSLWVGLMPHPEIALKRFDDPDRFGTDHFSHHRDRIDMEEGDGLRMMKAMFQREGVFQ
jgi:phosphoribosylformylglycinamidine synthase